MNQIHERPSLAERYAVAVGASSLKVQARKATAVDLILAAAMQSSGLGAMGMRTQAEFDRVKGELERAGVILTRRERAARRLERYRFAGTREKGFKDAVDGPSLAAAIREQAVAEAVTARCLILMELRTLQPLKTALGAYAVLAATKRRYMRSNDEVLLLTGRAIEIWLDPLCHECDGTGYFRTGYEGDVVKTCRVCRGSGKRSTNIGPDHHANRFAGKLLCDLDAAMTQAESEMGRLLRAS